MEEDESMMSQSNNGSVTPMAYSARQSVINSQQSNITGTAGKSNLFNKFAFTNEPKASAYKIRIPGEKPTSLDNFFSKVKSSPLKTESTSKERPKIVQHHIAMKDSQQSI